MPPVLTTNPANPSASLVSGSDVVGAVGNACEITSNPLVCSNCTSAAPLESTFEYLRRHRWTQGAPGLQPMRCSPTCATVPVATAARTSYLGITAERDPADDLLHPEYVRSVQYATWGELAARSGLHDVYGTVKSRSGTLEAAPSIAAETVCWSCWWYGQVLDNPTRRRESPCRQPAGMVGEAPAGHAAWATRCAVVALDDDSFDLVVANHMLYHVPDPAAALRVPACSAPWVRRRHQLAGAHAPAHVAIAEATGPFEQRLSLRHRSERSYVSATPCSIVWHTFVNALMQVTSVDPAYATSSSAGRRCAANAPAGLCSTRRSSRRRRPDVDDTRTGAFVAGAAT